MDPWCDDGGRCPPAWAKWTDGIYHSHRDQAKAGPAPTPFIVKIGPPDLTKSRTFELRFILNL